MLPSIEIIILALCWGLFILVWGLGWVYNLSKAPQSKDAKSVDYFSMIGLATIVLLSGFVLFFVRPVSIHFPLWIEAIGAVCLICATAFTLWSRFVLGTMWSIKPTAKVDHQLRTDGPYRISRHPIYTGLISMLLGSVLLSSANMIVIIATLVVMFRLLTKIPMEEKLMVETFGEQYLAYQKQVPQLIPGLQWLKKNKI